METVGPELLKQFITKRGEAIRRLPDSHNQGNQAPKQYQHNPSTFKTDQNRETKVVTEDEARTIQHLLQSFNNLEVGHSVLNTRVVKADLSLED